MESAVVVSAVEIHFNAAPAAHEQSAALKHFLMIHRKRFPPKVARERARSLWAAGPVRYLPAAALGRRASRERSQSM